MVSLINNAGVRFYGQSEGLTSPQYSYYYPDPYFYPSYHQPSLLNSKNTQPTEQKKTKKVKKKAGSEKNAKESPPSTEYKKEDLINWLKSLTLEERLEVFSIKNGWLAVVFVKMNKKWRECKDASFAQLRTDAVSRPSNEFIYLFDQLENYFYCRMNNKGNGELSEKHVAEKEIIQKLKLYDDAVFYDTITFHEDLLADMDKVLALFGTISGNCVFMKPYKVTNGEESKNNAMPQTLWFNENSFQSFGEWIVMNFEEHILFKYHQSKKNPTKHTSDFEILDFKMTFKYKRSLMEFWKGLEKSKKKKLVTVVKEIFEDLKNKNMERAGDNKEVNKMLKNFYNGPLFFDSKFATTVEHVTAYFTHLLEEEKEDVVIEAILMTSLDEFGLITSLICRKLSHKLRNMYSEKVASDLILNEEKEKNEQSQKKSKKKKNKKKAAKEAKEDKKNGEQNIEIVVKGEDEDKEEEEEESKIEIVVDSKNPKEEGSQVSYGPLSLEKEKGGLVSEAEIKDLESQMYNIYQSKFQQFIPKSKHSNKIPAPPVQTFQGKEISHVQEEEKQNGVVEENLENKEDSSSKDNFHESTKPASLVEVDEWSLFEDSEKKISKSQKKKQKRKSKKKAEMALKKAQEEQEMAENGEDNEVEDCEMESEDETPKQQVKEDKKKEIGDVKAVEKKNGEIKNKKEAAQEESKTNNNNKNNQIKEEKNSNKKKQNINNKNNKEDVNKKETIKNPIFENRSESSSQSSRRNSDADKKENGPVLFREDSDIKNTPVLTPTTSTVGQDFDDSGFIEVKARKKPEKEKETKSRRKKESNKEEGWRRKEASGKASKKEESKASAKTRESQKAQVEKKEAKKTAAVKEEIENKETSQKGNVGIPKIISAPVKKTNAKAVVQEKQTVIPACPSETSSENEATSCTSKTTTQTSSSNHSDQKNGVIPPPKHLVHSHSAAPHAHSLKNKKSHHPLSITSPCIFPESIKIAKAKEHAHQFFNKKFENDIYKHVANLTEQSNYSMTFRILAYHRLSYCISQLYPNNSNIKTQIFGSCATGLALPTSDIDISVRGIEVYDRNQICDNILMISNHLKQFKWVTVNKPIVTANVPIIKLEIDVNLRFNEMTEGATKQWEIPEDMKEKLDVEEVLNLNHPTVHVDMSLECLTSMESYDIHGGYKTTDFVQKMLQKYDSLYIITMVLKEFLNERNLLNAFQGGISSYCLVIMIVAIFQKFGDEGYMASLRRFFSFYGEVFQPEVMGIYLAEPKVPHEGSWNHNNNHNNPFFLLNHSHEMASFWVIEHITTQRKNIGAGSYSIKLILSEFAKASKTIESTRHKLEEFVAKHHESIHSVEDISKFENEQELSEILAKNVLEQCVWENLLLSDM